MKWNGISLKRVISSSSSVEDSCPAIIGTCQPFQPDRSEKTGAGFREGRGHTKLTVTQCLSGAY
jgi:hypothetical protein